jgi:hypothetical protein
MPVLWLDLDFGPITCHEGSKSITAFGLGVGNHSPAALNFESTSTISPYTLHIRVAWIRLVIHNLHFIPANDGISQIELLNLARLYCEENWRLNIKCSTVILSYDDPLRLPIVFYFMVILPRLQSQVQYRRYFFLCHLVDNLQGIPGII